MILGQEAGPGMCIPGPRQFCRGENWCVTFGREYDIILINIHF